MLQQVSKLAVAVAAVAHGSWQRCAVQGTALRGNGNKDAVLDAGGTKTSKSMFLHQNSSSENTEQGGNEVSIEKRKLSADVTFYPLDCNANLTSQNCSTFWSNSSIIECGSCYTIDPNTNGSTLEFSGGLDIIGQLLIPEDHQVTIIAPYVRVEGVLEIASTSIVTGTPHVKFILTGTDDTMTSFVPAGTPNSNACDGSCSVGKKPFVIAGGRINMTGMPTDIPTWVNLHDVDTSPNTPTATTLILEDSVIGGWGVGAEVLITPHTLDYDGSQVRSIDFINDNGDGFVTIGLNQSISRPTTIAESSEFAVEVALLSRNIQLVAETDDPNADHGGHFIVFHTPTVEQNLEGVEIINFGQQGVLGRYPIHFHMCMDVLGSKVSKNTIRESNQRCVVVHATHNLTVEDNIAYDTKGHCYMLEDGFEQDNVFRGNLGTYTQKVKVRIDNRPHPAPSDSDDDPSTFWITNTMNTFEGNVAAGCEENGYWFELFNFVRGSSADLLQAGEQIFTKRLALQKFKNNVAHSNAITGLRTYPHGYQPDTEAVFEGCRFYKNGADGIFFHQSSNLALIGGIFSDNRASIDLDRADNVRVENATVIGYSESFQTIVQSQSLLRKHCPNSNDESIVGIQLHPFKASMNSPAKVKSTVVQGIKFANFSHPDCANHSSSFDVDDIDPNAIRDKHFNYYTTLSNIEPLIGNELPSIDLCLADQAGVTDIVITDIDSSLKPLGSSATGVSSIVSSTPWMTTFIEDACVEDASRCHSYCAGSCLRTVTYSVNQAMTENYKLQVLGGPSISGTINVTGKFWYRTGVDEIGNTKASKHRIFAVSLPQGSYLASFLDENGNVAWPTYVEEIYEQPQCDPSLQEGSIELNVPNPAMGECGNLIKNGDAEADASNPIYWLHVNGGVTVSPNEGLDSSNALTDITHDSSNDAIAQYMDMRCLEQGNHYEIMAFVRLLNLDNSSYTCDPNVGCPTARLKSRTLSSSGLSMDESVFVDVAKTVRSFQHASSGFRLLHGVFTAHTEMTEASSVLFMILRSESSLRILIDDVSISSLSGDTICNELINNGDFDTGDSRFWDADGSEKLEIVTPGLDGNEDYALKMYDRASSQDTPVQYLRHGCLVAGARYMVTSRFLLGDASCNLDSNPGGCPKMRLWALDPGNEMKDIAKTVAHPISATGEWGTIAGLFFPSKIQEGARRLKTYWQGMSANVNLTLDSVSITPLDCSDIVLNTDFELGDARFWTTVYGGTLSVMSNGADGSSYALKYFGRTKNWAYVTQDLDKSCFQGGNSYILKAQLKLFSAGTDTTVSCIASGPGRNCPKVGVQLLKSDGNNPEWQEFSDEHYVNNSWNESEFNSLQMNFTIPADSSFDPNAVHSARIGFGNFEVDWDLLVDNIHITAI